MKFFESLVIGVAIFLATVINGVGQQPTPPPNWRVIQPPMSMYIGQPSFGGPGSYPGSFGTAGYGQFGQPLVVSVDRVVSEKSSGQWSSSTEVKEDPNYFGGSFPPGASRFENSHKASSWSIDLGSSRVSSQKVKTVSSAPSYDPFTGKPLIVTARSKSTAHFEQKTESVQLDRYGRPIGCEPKKRKGLMKFLFGSK